MANENLKQKMNDMAKHVQKLAQQAQQCADDAMKGNSVKEQVQQMAQMAQQCAQEANACNNECQNS